MPDAWRHCSRCKTPIAFNATYWTCSVSTCNRKRSQMVFCGMDCWDAHLPVARHREAWAEENTAPSAEQAASEARRSSASGQASSNERAAGRGPGSTSGEPTGREPVRREPVRREPMRRPAEPHQAARRVVVAAAPRDPDLPQDILIVATKLKAYIRAASGMNTSSSVMDVLSDRVRDLCDAAIRQAKAAERQTVLDRDFR